MNYQEILDFWFDPKNQSWWFSQNDAFDALIEEKFKTIHQQAAHAELWSWRSSAEGRLAEIIVLDQLSRNLYRNSSLAFAQDALALALAQEDHATTGCSGATHTTQFFIYALYA